MGILIICAIVSVLLFYFAPAPYSYNYCITCLSVFLISSFIMLSKNCKHTFVKFEFFFLFAFFFTNIIYAIVYYPINPYFFLFNLPFNEDYINRGLALSVMGISFFNIGVYENKPLFFDKSVFKNTSYYEPRKLFTILMMIYIPSLVVALMANAYVTDFTNSNINAILIFIVLYLIFAVFSNNVKSKSVIDFFRISNSKFIFFLLAIYILAYLVVGSRTIPLRLGSLILFLYSVFIANIQKKHVMLILIAGSAIMMIVSVFRARGDFDTNTLSNFWDIGMDLTINNRSLYVLMEEADLHGVNYGKTMLCSLAAIIPFGQSFLLWATGWSVKDVNSANLVTDLYFSTQPDYVEQYGLGTNLVGDVYIAFGTIGVITYMFLLGKILKYLYRNIVQGSSISVFYYAMIFVEVIYITRASSLEFLRNIAWGVFWIYFFNRFISKNKINEKNSIFI